MSVEWKFCLSSSHCRFIGSPDLLFPEFLGGPLRPRNLLMTIVAPPPPPPSLPEGTPSLSRHQSRSSRLAVSCTFPSSYSDCLWILNQGAIILSRRSLKNNSNQRSLRYVMETFCAQDFLLHFCTDVFLAFVEVKGNAFCFHVTSLLQLLCIKHRNLSMAYRLSGYIRMCWNYSVFFFLKKKIRLNHPYDEDH